MLITCNGLSDVRPLKTPDCVYKRGGGVDANFLFFVAFSLASFNTHKHTNTHTHIKNSRLVLPRGSLHATLALVLSGL